MKPRLPIQGSRFEASIARLEQAHGVCDLQISNLSVCTKMRTLSEVGKHAMCNFHVRGRNEKIVTVASAYLTSESVLRRARNKACFYKGAGWLALNFSSTHCQCLYYSQSHSYADISVGLQAVIYLLSLFFPSSFTFHQDLMEPIFRLDTSSLLYNRDPNLTSTGTIRDNKLSLHAKVFPMFNQDPNLTSTGTIRDNKVSLRTQLAVCLLL